MAGIFNQKTDSDWCVRVLVFVSMHTFYWGCSDRLCLGRNRKNIGAT